MECLSDHHPHFDETQFLSNRHEEHIFNDLENQITFDSIGKSDMNTLSLPNFNCFAKQSLYLGEEDTTDSDDDNNVYDNNYTINVNDCDYLQRMLHGLKYYDLLNLDAISDADIFINFCINVYPQILNDYQHIISTHSDHLEEIHEQLIRGKAFGRCDHQTCVVFKLYTRYSEGRDYRRHRKIGSSEEEKIDEKVLFFCDLFDSMHHWLFHIFDAGMRAKKAVIDGLLVMADESHLDDQYDTEFKKIKQFVTNKRKQFEVSNEVLGNDNNKFKLQISGTSTDEGGTTFTNNLLKHLKSANISFETRHHFIQFVKQEEFDSDAIVDDIIDHENGSNIISSFGNDTRFATIICEYIEEFQS